MDVRQAKEFTVARLRTGFNLMEFILRPTDWTSVIRPELPFGSLANEAFVRDLNESKTYLEFGSGSSTLAASVSATSRVVSVESDLRFMNAVRTQVEGVQNVQSKFDFLHVDIGLTGPWGVPVFKSQFWRMRRLWPNYSEAPWNEVGPEFRADFVLVDGRFRVACALAVCIHQADYEWKMLVDDFIDRPEYFPIKEFADLVEMRGRMAVFAPSSRLDLKTAAAALRHFQLDWR